MATPTSALARRFPGDCPYPGEVDMTLHKRCAKCGTRMAFINETGERSCSEERWTVTLAHFRCPNCATMAEATVLYMLSGKVTVIGVETDAIDNAIDTSNCKHPRLDLKDGVATCAICKKVVWNVLKSDE